MKPGLKDFDRFLRNEFSKKIRHEFETFKILSEADLQAHAWLLIQQFLEKFEGRDKFRVWNKPCFKIKKTQMHPDLAVFKRQKPWVLMELKERRKITVKQMQSECHRLLKARNTIRPTPKRGYFIYLSRIGSEPLWSGPKGKAGKYFYEIPILLAEHWTIEQIRAFEEEFKRKSIYVSLPKNEHH